MIILFYITNVLVILEIFICLLYRITNVIIIN